MDIIAGSGEANPGTIIASVSFLIRRQGRLFQFRYNNGPFKTQYFSSSNAYTYPNDFF
jgi:hypothetical protein